MDYENFYEALKYYLQKKGHGGQALICRHTDIPRSYLSRIVRKGRKAGPKTQKKIARFFGFGLEEFMETGRRITLGEDPDQAVDLMKNLPEEYLLQRLTTALRKEMSTARQLSRTQLLYKNIVENSLQMIVRFDKTMRISYVNRAAERMTDLGRTELLGLDWKCLVHDKYHDKLSEMMGGLPDPGGSFAVEAQGSFNNQWLYINVTLFPEEEGETDLGQLVAFDLTEKKKLVDKLKFIQHGVEMSYVPTLWVGDKANIAYVNRAVCDLLGYTREELEKMRVWDINPLITREKWADTWAWFSAEEKVVFAGQYKKKTGEIISVEFQVSNLEYPDGRRYNVVFVKSVDE